MNNLKKRCLTLLLSLAMIVTYMPTSMIAYAVDGADQAPAEQQVGAEASSEEATSEEAVVDETAVETEEAEEASEDVSSEETVTPEAETPAEPEESGETAVVEAEEDAEPEEAEEAEKAEDGFSEGQLVWNKGKYNVTVSYGADAEIPEGAKLVLTEFGENDKEYKEAMDALVADEDGNSAFSQTTEEEQKDLGMAAFDLTIYDKDGGVVEPKTDVSVSFKLNELPEGVDAEALAASMGHRIIDYFKDAELVRQNCIPTAEAALEIAMHRIDVTVKGTKTLIIGFGNVASECARVFGALGSEITCAVRREEPAQKAAAAGFGSVLITPGRAFTEGFDIIINTAPALVIDETQLLSVKRGALIIDLASKPGGTDFDAAARLGVQAVHALALPGKYAPVSAGEYIADTADRILKETITKGE